MNPSAHVARRTRVDNRSTVAPTRIAFIDMPRMLREILDDALTSRDDVSLVDEARNGGGLIDAVDRSGATFLIVSSESVGPVEVCKLLSERPRVKCSPSPTAASTAASTNCGRISWPSTSCLRAASSRRSSVSTAKRTAARARATEK